MPRIILLDDTTANQIAAGEVVERPASVVKELVENSFDAGATRVSVEIRGGGLDEIKVVDNGCGMDETDSVTAFQRHATSKITGIGDLEEICSLGFRGEALPSIAAVSKCILTTRPPEAVSGTRLEIQGGRILSVSPAGCPPGASITVRELFFNTPARLKYMKSKPTEAAQVSDIVSRLALARPDVAVKLSIDGRPSLQTPGTGNLLDVVAAVYGPETARGMLPLAASEGGITVGGLAAAPSVSRSSKRHITVAINGRHVKNNLVNAAIMEGYGTLLPRGRFPLAVVTLYMDPRLLDVNVHPSKMVIRVTGEDRLFGLIKRTVMPALRTDRIIPSYTPAAGADTPDTPAPGVAEYKNDGEDPADPGFPRKIRPGTLFRPEHHSTNSSVENTRVMEAAGPYPPTEDRVSGGKGDALLEGVYPIGFLPPTYILAGSGEGLLIIDHHAAHERILYEKYLKLLGGEKVDSQILLVPSVVQLTPREYQTAEENLELLAGLGISAAGFGSESLVVREIPSGLPDKSAGDLVRDLLEYLMEPGGSVGREDLVKKMATSAACRSAIKSGTRSTLEEARAIIRDLKETKVPYACPHGRPTIISISEQELKLRFKRT